MQRWRSWSTTGRGNWLERKHEPQHGGSKLGHGGESNEKERQMESRSRSRGAYGLAVKEIWTNRTTRRGVSDDANTIWGVRENDDGNTTREHDKGQQRSTSSDCIGNLTKRSTQEALGTLSGSDRAVMRVCRVLQGHSRQVSAHVHTCTHQKHICTYTYTQKHKKHIHKLTRRRTYTTKQKTYNCIRTCIQIHTCAHVYTHIYPHLCTSIHLHAHMCTKTCTANSTHIQTHMYTHMYTRKPTYLRTSVYTFTHTHSHSHEHTHAHNNTHTHQHTDLHTCIHTCTHTSTHTCTHTHAHKHVHAHTYTHVAISERFVVRSVRARCWSRVARCAVHFSVHC